MNTQKKVDPAQKDNDVSSKDGERIENKNDVHESTSGNVAEPDAEKNMLDGPSIDLVGQPSGDDK